MRRDNPSAPDDDLRPEYDASVLKGGVRGKYLERYRAGTNLGSWLPTFELRSRRMKRSTRRSGRSCMASNRTEVVPNGPGRQITQRLTLPCTAISDAVPARRFRF